MVQLNACPSPDNEWIKINCDGVYDSISGNVGIRVVTRKFLGQVKTWVRRIVSSNSALVAEAKVLKEGVLLAIKQVYEKF